MGIKNLKVILQRKCKNAINIVKLESYRGMKLALDLSIFLYKAKYNNGEIVELITKLILRLLKNHITPVFVFDGKPPKEKDEVLQYRRERKNIMKIKKIIVEKCLELDRSNLTVFQNNINDFIQENSFSSYIDDEEINFYFNKNDEELEREIEKIGKKIIYISAEDIEICKNLFDLFGIKYIHAPCEAECLVAILCKNNLVDGCISEDSDILANGGFLFLRNLSPDKNTIEEYCLHGILESMQFNYDEFLDLCILCGCDYTSKINGLGPITAYKIIQKYGNIEEFLKINNKYIIPENFNYVKARDLFKNPISKDIFDKIDKDFKMNQPKIELLKLFIKKNSKLKDKYFKIIDDNLINYYLNIENMNEYDYNKKDNKNDNKNPKKITDFYQII
jgi:flap endonuclease-1